MSFPSLQDSPPHTPSHKRSRSLDLSKLSPKRIFPPLVHQLPPLQSPPKDLGKFLSLPPTSRLFCTNGDKLLKEIESATPFYFEGTRYTLVRSLGSGFEGPAFLVKNDAGEQSVLKLKNEMHDAKVHSAIALQLFEYALWKKWDLPIAIHHAFEPLIKREDLQQCCQIQRFEPRHNALKKFTSEHVTSGAYRVDYIPNSFPDRRDDVPDDEEELAPWLQLKKLFAQLLEHGIPADLQRSNVGLDSKGTLYCFDLRPREEEEEGIGDEVNPFFLLIPHLLDTFTITNGPMWHWLDPRPPGQG